MANHGKSPTRLAVKVSPRCSLLAAVQPLRNRLCARWHRDIIKCGSGQCKFRRRRRRLDASAVGLAGGDFLRQGALPRAKKTCPSIRVATEVVESLPKQHRSASQQGSTNCVRGDKDKIRHGLSRK
ncbi:hypothetical protein E4U43_004166 [Claviceps pusilla]|uniref:Uncharacterized protein n=1 Tax=Claviceps pusilla TaxID=123648 RepID=A0A9P7N3R3_9HYPO|nr:hypothetical protein E4U43_004166 [Claviceps pusilla]